jgi:hypothetical protein
MDSRLAFVGVTAVMWLVVLITGSGVGSFAFIAAVILTLLNVVLVVLASGDSSE